MLDIFSDPYTWVTISFLGFVAIVYFKGKTSITNMLDAYIASIRAQIKEAEKLNKEALAQANEFETKHKNALAEAEQIVADAKTQAQNILVSGEKEVEARLIAREKQLDAEMAQLKENAMSELRTHMAKLIESETQALMKAALKKGGSNDLIKNSIAQVKAAKEAA